jgi:hypothetical protein
MSVSANAQGRYFGCGALTRSHGAKSAQMRRRRAAGGAHVLRVRAVRWIGLPPEGGVQRVLEKTSVGVLGYEHECGEPVLCSWIG